MKKLLFYLLLTTSILFCFTCHSKSLDEWNSGMLDIHVISTGQGNCQLIVFPDGTKLMIDCGDKDRKTFLRKHPEMKCHPLFVADTSTTAKTVARYVNHLGLGNKIDYFLLTHFHADHFGALYGKKLRKSSNGKYFLTGLMELDEYLSIRCLVDRDFPKYEFPVALKQLWKDRNLMNYFKFVDWKSKQEGVKVENFRTGDNRQFQPVYEPDRFKNFRVLNIKGNNLLSLNDGSEIRTLFKASDMIEPKGVFSENMLSCAIVVEYGKFRYYTGGDNTGSAHKEIGNIHDVESKMGPVVGKVTAMTLNHHGNKNATSESFLESLDPSIVIIQGWSGDHPGKKVAQRLIDKNIGSHKREIYSTSFSSEDAFEIGDWFGGCLTAKNIHVVIRVFPDSSYKVIGIDAASAEYDVIYESNIRK